MSSLFSVPYNLRDVLERLSFDKPVSNPMSKSFLKRCLRGSRKNP